MLGLSAFFGDYPEVIGVGEDDLCPGNVREPQQRGVDLGPGEGTGCR